MDETKEYLFKKVIKCGDVYECVEYLFPIRCGEGSRSISHEVFKKDSGEKRLDNLVRCRQQIRRIIWCNIGRFPKFVTFTYARSELNVDVFLYDWKQFVKRMSRRNFKLRYVYVLENQKERGAKEGNVGSIHAHAVIFNDEYIPQDVLQDCWKQGFVSIEAIDHVHNLGAYVCKYLTKENLAEFNRKSYHCSRGLKQPEEYRVTGFKSGDFVFGDPDLWNKFDSHIDYYYNGVSTYEFTLPDGTLFTNSVKYRQGRLKE